MRQAPGSHFLRSFYSACLRLLFYLFSLFFTNTFQTKSSYLERRKGARKATIRQPPYHRGNFRTPHCFRKTYLFQTILLHRSCIWQVPKLSLYLQINFQCLFFFIFQSPLICKYQLCNSFFSFKSRFFKNTKKGRPLGSSSVLLSGVPRNVLCRCLGALFVSCLINIPERFLKLHGKQDRRKCHCDQIRDRLGNVNCDRLIGLYDLRHNIDQRY